MSTEIDILKRRLQREIAARKEAEAILEKKALELYHSNEKLQQLNQSLEQTIEERTKELVESKKQFQSLVESAGDIIYNADMKGYFTYVNPVTSKLLGFSIEELIGKHYTDLVLDEYVEEVRSFYLNVLDEKISASYLEFPVYAKDGTVFWLGQRVQIDFTNPEHAEITAVARDITANKKLQKDLEAAKEAAIEAQQAEKDFLAHMSHEIRTPLNAILGMANLLNTTRLDKLQENYVEDIRYAADTLHGLISDVLDISKIEAGEVDVVESNVDLNLAISMLCKTLDFRVKERGNSLNYHIANEVPRYILADKNFINQILYNLVYNAIKFTKKGTIGIDVSLADKLENDDLLLRFDVSDTGIGIKKERIPLVFDRYKQETKETNRKYGGTGLGLAITKKLVALHGGAISVVSDKGRGATFTFTLKVKAGTGHEELPGVHVEERSLNQVRVLIAEDNDLNLKYIETILSQWGVSFKVARNGQQAVTMSQQEPFDAILMDMHMPVMDGYEAAIQIRSDKDNPNHSSKILALTASALLDEKRKARKAGMDDHLTKPFTPDALYSFIKQHVHLIAKEEEEGKSVFDSLHLPEIIDKKTLSDFYQDERDYAGQMVAFYLGMIDGELEKGRAFFIDSNYDELVRWVHKLVPNFVMVGLPQYTVRFKDLELKLKKKGAINGYEDDVVSLLDSLVEANKAVEELNKALQI